MTGSLNVEEKVKGSTRPRKNWKMQARAASWVV